MKKIAITGANGYLASLIQTCNKDDFTFIPITRTDLNLTKPEAVAGFFEQLDFDVVFHTAARTQTADCEAHPEETGKVNRDSAVEIAKACRKKGTRFIFISTEQVFNNKKTAGPFSEDEEVDSTSLYGQQKIAVEQFLQEREDLDFLVLRLSWMMGLSFPQIKESPNIIRNVMNALFFQHPTKFTLNEVRGMTYINNLAEQFGKIIELPKGIYHFSSNNELNTFEAAKLIGRELGFNEEKIERFILADEQKYADRSRDLRLSTDKIRREGITIADFAEDVQKCLKDFGWMKG